MKIEKTIQSAFQQVGFHAQGKSEKSHEYKTLEAYAHDYRDIAMSEENLMDMLSQFAESLNCDHQCSSNCRREGCNCDCGEYHY